MHAAHHRNTRLQFAVAGIALLAFMAAGSLLLPTVPLLRPVFAAAGFGPAAWRPTVEDRAVASMLAMVDDQHNAIAAIPHETTSTDTTSASGVPVLLYHGFLQTTSTDAISVDYGTFIAQMSALAQNGWHTVSLADFRDYLEKKKTLPAKSFLLTFDDGRKDSYYLTDPVLEKTGFTAVMFVIGVHMDDSLSPYYLRTHELLAMKSSGRWEIQSHGFNDHNLEVVDANGKLGHFVSDALWLPDQNRVETADEHRARVHEDFTHARALFEQTFGTSVYAYAYPFGDYGQASADRDGSTESMVLEETQKVYELGFGQVDTEGTESDQNVPQDHPFLVKRITVNPAWNAQNLLELLAAGTPKTLPYEDALAHPPQWVTGWGNVTSATNTLTLAAKPDGTGAMALLRGSEQLENERMEATVTAEKGESFSLVGAYRDEKNYVSCDYTAHTITLRVVTNGVEQQRQWWSRSAFSGFGNPREPVDAAIILTPDAPACVIHNIVAIELPLTQALSAGSVGFKTWNSSLDASLLTIHSVRILRAHE